MPFVCLTCGAELSERDENSEDFGCAFCGGFLTESQTQQQDFLDSAELRDGTKAGGADFSTRRRFQRGEFRQHVDDLEPCEERHLNWELYVKYNYGLKNQQEIFQQMLVAAAICFNCDPTMVLEHGKQLWFQFLESIQVDETPGQVHNEDAMALQFSHLNGLVQHITDRIVGYYNPGPFEHCFKRREKCAWVKLALQKHEQLLQGRLKQLQKATGHHSILTAPGFGRLSSVQRAEILRQEVRKRTQARLRLMTSHDKPILIDSHGQVVPHDGLEEKEKQEFYQRLLHEHAVVADAEASLSGDSSDEEQRVAESKEAEEAEEAQRPAAREKKKAKAIAEQVILASDSEEATAKNMASHPKKKVAAPLKNQNPKQVEDDPGANYHDAEDVTERRRLFLAMIWMALSSSGQAVLLGDVILAAFQGPLKPWIEKYEHLEFLKRSIRLPPLNQDTLYEQLKARCGRLIRCRYRFLSQHPEMFLHRFAGLLEDERSVMEWARMCCRSRHLAGYWQRMIMSIEQFYGLCAKVKGVSDKYKEGSEWCPASKAFFCVLAGMRLKKMQADEEAKVQDMLDKQSWEKAQKEGEKDQEEGKDKVEVPEGGRLWTAKGLKSIPALYEKKAVKKAKSKPQYTDRVQLRTTTNLKNRQRERSRSRGAGRDDAKDIGKKGQKEQNDERQGKEDEQTRHMKYMARLARLALEMTETLMGKKCRDTAVQFTLHADLLATEIYRGTGRKRPQILRGPLVAALDAAN